jgi:cyclopropane-fatty-acyl-phospholipid synthase
LIGDGAAPMPRTEQSTTIEVPPGQVHAGGLLRHSAPSRVSTRHGAALRRVVLAAGGRRRDGTIEIAEAGSTRRVGGGEPVARVTVRDPRAYGALLRSGSVGLGTSYVAGWWDADDLTVLVQVLFRWTRRWRARLDGLGRRASAVLDPAARLMAPSPADDRRNVQAHYDLSNDFFELMLDETMTYSCAVFDHPEASLAQAQEAKIDRLCVKLGLRPEDRVVEIGSGWGGFALHAATHYGCRVTTTTISEAQRTYVAKRVAESGLADRVTVLGDDWRDLRGRFSRLVSIEMIEAVDWRRHDEFLSKCANLLDDDGLAVLQAIVIDERSFERAKRHQDFVRRMVFPGGCIPSVASLTASIARTTDLRMVDLEDIGRHYAETLRHWAGNLRERQAEVEHLGVEPAFRRLWALYLAYCEASFLERHLSDVQLVLAKPAWRGRLQTRPT